MTDLVITNHGRDRYAQRVHGYPEGVGGMIREGAIEDYDELDAEIQARFEECIPASMRPHKPEHEGTIARIHPGTYTVFLYRTWWSHDHQAEVRGLVSAYGYQAHGQDSIRLPRVLHCSCCAHLYREDTGLPGKCNNCGSAATNGKPADEVLGRFEDAQTDNSPDITSDLQQTETEVSA